ncbi:MAG TPA: phosphopyruvate hydratase [Bryobacteraceae bacterium]|nr:phosphopyruvate hydratase [Bryobacteraceae bacterium]
MPGTAIRRVRGRRVWDSRGRPTVEADVELECGAKGRSIAPAGASTGSCEAIDLRDEDGFDVRRAVANVNGAIAHVLAGADAADQAAVDQRMIEADGTVDKRRLGGNATIAVSMAALHAAAAAQGVPLWQYLAPKATQLPLPEIQIFGGGAHAARRIDIQDLMVVCLSAASFAEALDRTAAVYRAAGRDLASRGRLEGVADEGGYWPAFASNEEAIEALVRAIESAGLVPGSDAALSLDIAASQFGSAGNYRLARDGRCLDTDAFIDLLGRWIERYPIVSIEDPLAEDDREGFRRFTAAFGNKTQIVGDDLLATNAQRVREAAAGRECTAVLIKPNQAGTITETRAALDAARACGLDAIVSARSGETEDVTIVHLAVGWEAAQLKVGSFSRSERMAKWNEALRIEEAIGTTARLARLA